MTVYIPASFGRRMGAMLYDSFLLLAIFMAISAFWVAINQGEALNHTHSLFYWQRLSYGIAFICFYTFFWCRAGQTLGMRAWRIRVQQSSGKPLSIGQSLWRLLAAFISFICLGMGFFWIFIHPSRLAWHDSWTNTEIIFLN